MQCKPYCLLRFQPPGFSARVAIPGLLLDVLAFAVGGSCSSGGRRSTRGREKVGYLRRTPQGHVVAPSNAARTAGRYNFGGSFALVRNL